MNLNVSNVTNVLLSDVYIALIGIHFISVIHLSML